ncbi:hypothetical protein PoB_001775300 [Plakobranchus ocellatus]|uniref:Uncharacterized protein n=1 Tax=Plakobranchus ocellatus TaxID=259542 RepID=A0AAV3Z922_9GAST|nr:hypothetical protein PoB_001775300 [Plakobranchus ocellatus]
MKKTFTHLDLATYKTRQETRQDRRREKITIIMSELDSNPHPRRHPPPYQTEEPGKQALSHPLPRKIEAFDSSHSPSHSIRLEHLC